MRNSKRLTGGYGCWKLSVSACWVDAVVQKMRGLKKIAYYFCGKLHARSVRCYLRKQLNPKIGLSHETDTIRSWSYEIGRGCIAHMQAFGALRHFPHVSLQSFFCENISQ
jgi:hypothetical protein